MAFMSIDVYKHNIIIATYIEFHFNDSLILSIFMAQIPISSNKIVTHCGHYYVTISTKE